MIKAALLADKKNQQDFIDKIISPMVNNNLEMTNLKFLYDALQDPALKDMWKPFAKQFGKLTYATFKDFTQTYFDVRDAQAQLTMLKNMNGLDEDIFVSGTTSDAADFKKIIESILANTMDDPINWLPLVINNLTFLMKDKDANTIIVYVMSSHVSFMLATFLETEPTNLHKNLETHLFDVIGSAYGDIQFVQLALLYKSKNDIVDQVIKDMAKIWRDEKDARKKNYVFTVSEDIATFFGLIKGTQYTTADLLFDPALKLDQFLGDFGIVDLKAVEKKVFDFGVALGDIR